MLCSIVTQIFGIPCEILTPFPNPVTSVLFSLKQIRDFAGREQPWGLALKAAPPLFFPSPVLSRSVDCVRFEFPPKSQRVVMSLERLSLSRGQQAVSFWTALARSTQQ